MFTSSRDYILQYFPEQITFKSVSPAKPGARREHGLYYGVHADTKVLGVNIRSVQASKGREDCGRYLWHALSLTPSPIASLKSAVLAM